MASKPDKFGIKFWLAVDAESHYLVNGFPYLGKDTQRPKSQSLTEYVVTKLAEPFLNEGRNITCDNFFTSVKLANSLKSKKTTIVGTMNKIRREVPKAIKTMKLPLYSTRIFKNEGITLTVYQGKPSKNVLVLSSVHKAVPISDTPKKLPESVVYYNHTKSGVDNIDQMARLYTTKVASRRWPLQVFYNILDFAAINAKIVYNETNGTKFSRRKFILKLIQELTNVNATMNDGNGEEAANEEDEYEEEEILTKRKACQVRQCKNNKSNSKCYKCKRIVCGKCTAKVESRSLCKICHS